MSQLKQSTIQGLLRLAVEQEDRAAVELAIALGANLEEFEAHVSGPAPFFQTCISGNAELCALFLDSGCSVNLRDWSGSSALHCAAGHGSAQVISLLLERGAELEARGEDNMTPLMIALRHDQFESALALARAGADMLAQDNYQRCAQGHCQELGLLDILAAAEAHQLELASGGSMGSERQAPSPRL